MSRRAPTAPTLPPTEEVLEHLVDAVDAAGEDRAPAIEILLGLASHGCTAYGWRAMATLTGWLATTAAGTPLGDALEATSASAELIAHVAERPLAMGEPGAC